MSATTSGSMATPTCSSRSTTRLIKQDEILDGFATTYRVGDITYGVVLAYNTDKTAGVVPEGWADFFDTAKIPGKRGLWKYSTGGVLEFALMADGVKPADLYTPTLDVDRAIKKLDTIKDDIVWWDSGAQSQELIGSGEVAMSMIWNGRGYSAKHTDNKPVEMQWNQQILTADYFVVPKGTPNKQVAMEFIAWARAPTTTRRSPRRSRTARRTRTRRRTRRCRRSGGHERRREHRLLQRRVPHRQLRRDRRAVPGLGHAVS